ncbi:YqeG family HAD IIIA-type phosphatase [Iocasia frigidifontis]|uniref:YqeG family HAD IIIA-type phosphatase n=1 Tax=Iocasia fonsfrigidae TaxID=2682810 RepID=A0A8A7KBE6_9FIRM|nr:MULTISPECIES: YqeG family HAD IIIA-type phosphatase [Halanaerobiaceae]AZO95699.1 YqeG family HAD IIIA-type phosphatase [Halocella sp. SP3-1]QTL98560.1 YqeG family HAD IIIA-type phosphatase [Iocasia fonsfrigidae]
MINKLKPDQYYQDVFLIDFDLLKKQGIKGVICDIDNTIVPWSEEEILQEIIDWFSEIKDRGFQICLVSNGTAKRVNYFSEKLDLPAFGQAVKPAGKAFRKAQTVMALNSSEIVVIGDQLFTDVFGGNRMGFVTILVDPMNSREFFTTRIMRLLERMFFKRGEEK